MFCPGLYMIGYGRGKIIFEIPAFCRLNEENQERENSKHQMKKNPFLFLFHLILNFPLLKFLVHTALWTTLAHPSGQFLKHVNGCILGVKLFYKHSFEKKLFFF